jgi:Rod binding domain-containing protein
MEISSAYNAFSANARLTATPEASTHAARSAKEFEAMVIAQLLAPIFETVKQPGLTSGGPGEDVFGAMLQEHYAGAIAERGGFGIADQVRNALIAIQAERSAQHAIEGRGSQS